MSIVIIKCHLYVVLLMVYYCEVVIFPGALFDCSKQVYVGRVRNISKDQLIHVAAITFRRCRRFPNYRQRLAVMAGCPQRAHSRDSIRLVGLLQIHIPPAAFLSYSNQRFLRRISSQQSDRSPFEPGQIGSVVVSHIPRPRNQIDQPQATR